MGALIALLVAGPASAHDYNCNKGNVKSGHLILRDNTRFNTALENAVSVWDAVGSIAVTRISSGSSATADVNVRDYSGGASGVYGYHDCSGLISANVDEIAGNRNNQLWTLAHETGHALGIGHTPVGTDWASQLMYPTFSAEYEPHGHDRADYRKRWGPNSGGCAGAAQSIVFDSPCNGESLLGDQEPATPAVVGSDLVAVLAGSEIDQMNNVLERVECTVDSPHTCLTSPQPTSAPAAAPTPAAITVCLAPGLDEPRRAAGWADAVAVVQVTQEITGPGVSDGAPPYRYFDVVPSAFLKGTPATNFRVAQIGLPGGADNGVEGDTPLAAGARYLLLLRHDLSGNLMVLPDFGAIRLDGANEQDVVADYRQAISEQIPYGAP